MQESHSKAKLDRRGERLCAKLARNVEYTRYAADCRQGMLNAVQKRWKDVPASRNQRNMSSRRPRPPPQNIPTTQRSFVRRGGRTAEGTSTPRFASAWQAV
jgi:hypothetical protein